MAMASTTFQQLLSYQAGMASFVGLRGTPARMAPASSVAFPVRSTRALSVRAATVVDPKKDDNSVYSKFAGTEVQSNGEDFRLLKEVAIGGLLKSDDIKELKLLDDRVLIKLSKAEEKTFGGVLLANSAEKPNVGQVVAVGPGTIGGDGTRKPLELAVGDSVLYSKYAGYDFKGKDGSPFVVLRESDILAVLS